MADEAMRPVSQEKGLPGSGTSKNVSRRGFLKTTGAAAATTLAFPYIIPNHVLAAPGREGANDRINIGHIGVGGQGSYHVRSGAVAICDVDPNHAAAAAKKAGGNPAIYKDFRQLLENKDVDAVMIATPDHWHAIMSIMAMQAGKDVYSEKPVCKTIQEAQAMQNAVERYQKVLPVRSGCADVVTAGEVLEHVADPRRVIAEACRLLRPGGMLVVDTINATALARLLAVRIPDRLPKVAPRGLHDPNLFVSPRVVVDECARHGVAMEIRGLRPRVSQMIRFLATHRGDVTMVPTWSTAVLYQGIGVRGQTT